MVLSAFLSVTTIITDLSAKYFIAIASILLAVVTYYFFVYKGHRLRKLGMFSATSFSMTNYALSLDGFTLLTQKLFSVVSAEEKQVL